MQIIAVISNRSDALQSGDLLDVTSTAKEAGFKVPVALTKAAWMDCVAWKNEDNDAYQDESGRLWDVLWMAKYAASQTVNKSQSLVTVYLQRVPVGKIEPEETCLSMWIHAGDEGEPVVTIMLPSEMQELADEY